MPVSKKTATKRVSRNVNAKTQRAKKVRPAAAPSSKKSRKVVKRAVSKTAAKSRKTVSKPAKKRPVKPAKSAKSSKKIVKASKMTKKAIKKPVRKTSKVPKKVAKGAKKPAKAAKKIAKPAKKVVKVAKKSKAAKPAKKAAKVLNKAAKKPVVKAGKKAAKKPVAKAAKKAVKKAPKAPARRVLPKPLAKRVLVRPPVVATTKSKAKRGKTKITASDKKEFRQMLVNMRERTTVQIKSLKKASLQRSEKMVTAEDGTDVFERQFALTLVSSEQESLHYIDHALRRIDAGAYGICEDCTGRIEKPRLKALPFVRLCIGCQSAKEQNRPRYLAMR